MSTVVTDLVEESTMDLTPSGFTATRVYLVDGVAGVAASRPYTAITDVGLPIIGAAHPAVATIYCAKKTAKCLGPSQFKVTCNYEPITTQLVPDDDATPLITVGASLQQVESCLDSTGTIVTLSYPGYQPIAAKFQKSVPQPILSLERFETASPGANALSYVGKTNSGVWQGGAAHTWLCTRIQGTSKDGGDNYTVTYEFQYDPDTWKKKVYFRRADGTIPDDVVENTSWRTVQIYQTADFTALNI